jgi:hypothetical protein
MDLVSGPANAHLKHSGSSLPDHPLLSRISSPQQQTPSKPGVFDPKEASRCMSAPENSHLSDSSMRVSGDSPPKNLTRLAVFLLQTLTLDKKRGKRAVRRTAKQVPERSHPGPFDIEAPATVHQGAQVCSLPRTLTFAGSARHPCSRSRSRSFPHRLTMSPEPRHRAIPQALTTTPGKLHPVGRKALSRKGLPWR